MTRIQPGDRVEHVDLAFGEGRVLEIYEDCNPPDAVVQWDGGIVSRSAFGFLRVVPKVFAGGEL